MLQFHLQNFNEIGSVISPQDTIFLFLNLLHDVVGLTSDLTPTVASSHALPLKKPPLSVREPRVALYWLFIDIF